MGSRGESHLGAGSGERQPLAGRLPRTTNSSGRSKSEPAQAREARDRRGHPVPLRGPSVPAHETPASRRPLGGPGLLGLLRGCRSLPLGKQNLKSEVMENFIRIEAAAEPALLQPSPPCYGSFSCRTRPRRGLGSEVLLGRGHVFLAVCGEGSKPGPSPSPAYRNFAAVIPDLCCSKCASFPPRSGLAGSRRLRLSPGPRCGGCRGAGTEGEGQRGDEGTGHDCRSSGSQRGGGRRGNNDSGEEAGSTAGKQEKLVV